MAKCKLSIDIDAPVETLWLLTQNAARRGEWDFRINKAELIGTPILRKGSRFKSYGSLIFPFQMEMEYVTVEPNRRSAVKLIGCIGIPFKSGGGSWHYRDLGGGKSRFTTNILMTTTNSWFGKLTDRYVMEPFLKWMTLKSLKKLKEVAEEADLQDCTC